MNGDTWIFLALCGALLVFLLAASFLSKNYSLDRIKSKTVGDGQHGTARWATPKEIGKTYHTVPFRPRRWRKGKELPTEQGLILGSVGGGKRKSKGGSLLKISRKLLEKLRRPVAGKQKRKPKKKSKALSKIKKMIEEQGDIRALVDSDDIHCLMIGASGVGKTAFFLVPQSGIRLRLRHELSGVGYQGGSGAQLRCHRLPVLWLPGIRHRPAESHPLGWLQLPDADESLHGSGESRSVQFGGAGQG